MSNEIAALNIKVETGQVKDASKELDNLAQSGTKAETATDKLQRSMLNLKGVVTGLAAAFGAYQIATYIKDSAMLAARYETLGITMTQAGHNAGYTKQQMEDLESSLRKQGIAGVEAREVLTRLAASHMDLSKASEMARAAQNLAVSAGINSSEAFERLVHGIQSGQVETLRTLNLQVNFEKSYKDLAKQLKVNVDQLTESEKMQARMNATLNAARGYVGLYEQAMGSAGKQITSFTRYWKDAQVELGNSELPALTGMVKKATEEIKNFQEWVKRTDVQERFAVIGQSAATAFDAAVKFGGIALNMFTNILNGWNNLPEPIKEYGLLAAILGGRKGKLIGIGVATISDYADRIGRVGKAIELVRSGQASYSDIPLFDQDKFEAWLRTQDTITGLQIRLQNVRQEIASGAGVSVYAQENEDHRLKLLQTERDLVAQIAAEKARARVASAAALPEGALKTQEAEKRELTKAQIDKARHATESISVDLAKANDVADEGTGKIAELQRKYDEYALVLGKTNPLVRQFAVLLGYARTHLGNTPAEVHKATEEVLKHTRAMQGEIDALQAVAGLYGEDYSDRLTMLRAETEAQERYNEAIKKGVSVQNAAAEKSVALAKAQAEITARKQQGAKGIAAGFSGDSYEAQRRELIASYEEAKNYTNDRVALEAELQSKLAALESARLKKTESGTDGMKAALLDYSESVGTASSRMATLWNSGFKSMEDALVEMGMKGETSITSLFNTIRAEALRTQLVRPLMAGLAGFDFAGMFSGIFHDGGIVGQTAAPTRLVPSSLFSGAPRFHDGLMPDEFPAILQKGEAVIPRDQVGRMGSGGGSKVEVHLHNYTGAPVKTKESTGPGGQRQLHVIVGDMVKGAFASGQMDRTMQQNFGISRRGR